MNWVEIIDQIKTWLWSGPLALLVFGTGVYLTYILKGFQFRYLGFAFKQVFAAQAKQSKGDISQFEALMTSLAGAIGTGAIVGIATGITIGGVGSLFWMWITALLSMATKYAESLLAVRYRKVDKRGEMIGGPMEYMEDGLGWPKLAMLFAVLGIFATIGTGNLVQVNSIVDGVNYVWDINPLWTGVAVLVFTGLVILGGIKSIGHVAAVLVPVMALFYIIGGSLIILMNLDKVPGAFAEIISAAFTGQGAIGGFTGSTMMLAIQMGVSRSIFSNEAGMGISTMAAAAAITDRPPRQAMITMTGALVSTVVVCTITGLVLAITGVIGQTNSSGQLLTGAAMAIQAFESSLTGGKYVVSIGLVLFAWSTIIAWSYYGEKCFEYLFGEKWIFAYRIMFILLIIPGALLELDTVWVLADFANALMVIPNLIAVIALSKVVLTETNSFIKYIKEES